jgi:hypothetical protein
MVTADARSALAWPKKARSHTKPLPCVPGMQLPDAKSQNGQVAGCGAKAPVPFCDSLGSHCPLLRVPYK